MIPIARPINYLLEKRYIVIDDFAIEVYSNCVESVYNVIPAQMILTDKPKTIIVEFAIVLYYSPLIGSEFTVYKQPKPEELDEYYQPNSKYVSDLFDIEENEYPNKTIHFNHDNKTFVVLSGNKDVFAFYVKRYIKKMACIHYKENGYRVMHAGAVSYNNAAYIIIGPSHSGKSTFCFNLSLEGVDLINDDILFLKVENKKLMVKSIHMNPCIRKSAKQYVIDYEKRVATEENYYSPYNETYYIKKKLTNNSAQEVKGLFFLTGNVDKIKEEPIQRITFPDMDSNVINAMTQFDKELLGVDSEIASIIKNLPSFSICLGRLVKKLILEFKRKVMLCETLYEE